MSPTTPLDSFEERLAQNWPPTRWANVGVLIAVSGGADSVALLHALAKIAARQSPVPRIEVAHFHHGLRGASADEDAHHVAQISARLGLPHHMGYGQPDANSEEKSRERRYTFLQDIARRQGLRYLATAHHRDDQVETVLQRVIRGTGLRGLSGIPRVRAVDEALTIVRPLLWARRPEMRDYLLRLGESFREDPTNESLQFTRNRVRHELLPFLQQNFNPQVHDALYRLGTLAAEATAELEPLITELREQLVDRISPTTIAIDVNGLSQLSRFLTAEVLASLYRELEWPLQSMGHEQWTRLYGLLQTADMVDLPGGVRATRHGERLLLSRTASFTDSS